MAEELNLQINWDGRLLGCCDLFTDDWGINVFQHDFLECVNMPLYRQTLIHLLEQTPVDEDSPCYQCKNAVKAIYL